MTAKIQPKPGFLLNPLHPLSKNLIAWWLFNESGGIFINNYAPVSQALTTASDQLTGVLLDVNPINAWSGGGPFGGAIHLDAGDERVLISDVPSGTDNWLDPTMPLSVSWWEKVSTIPGAGVFRARFIFSVQGTSDRFNCFRSNAANYTYLCWGKAPNTNQGIRATDAPTFSESFDVWNHFAITCQTPLTTDPADCRAWVNGVELTIAQANSFGTPISDDIIGNSNANDNFTQAYLSDLRVYNRSLDTPDVLELYYNPFGNVITNKLPRFIQNLIGIPPASSGTARHLRRRRLLFTRY